MPKSRLRGGKKSHRKRVEKRNNNIKNQQNRIQKIWEQELTKRMEELKLSGETENQEVDTSQPLDIKV
jgi:transposase